MLAIIGIVMVLVTILGSYLAQGGKLYVLNQPFELVIIFGCGVCAFVVANRPRLLMMAVKKYASVFKGGKYSKQDVMENLMVQFQIYRLIKQRGALALEQHVDRPLESPLFTSFSKFCSHHEVLIFFCDYLRMISLGTDNPHQIESLMEEDLRVMEKDEGMAVQSLFVLADSFPALGIVAAVLGVIKTMSHINEPPEVLGNLIAAALVGTFLGVLLCYGWFSPLANSAKQVYEEEKTYIISIKAGLVAYLNGNSPAVCIEFARKAIASHLRPSFEELESSVAELPNPTSN